MENKIYQEYFNQGDVLIANGNYEEAIKYLKKAEAEDPNHVELHMKTGIAYANMNQLDDAEKAFKKALYVDKKCGEAYFHLACIAGLKDEMDQAFHYIETARVNGYANAQVYFTQGMMYEEQDNVSMAVRNYNKALSMEPFRADIHLQKCNLLIQSDRKEEALEALDSMIMNAPDYFEGYHLKCTILSEMKKYDEAETVLKQGMDMFPEDMGFQVDRARLLSQQQKYSEAAALLEEIEPKAGDWKRAVLMEEVRIAGVQEQGEKTKELLQKAYEQCRDGDQPDEEISYLLMSVHMSLKEYEQVIPMAKAIMESARNNTYSNIAHFYYAEALKNTGKSEEAKTAFEETVKICRAASLANAAALDAYMLRALSLNRLGENEKALEMLDYILTLAPDSAEVHSAKAVVLKDMGRTEEMAQEVKRVNEIGGALGQIVSGM